LQQQQQTFQGPAFTTYRQQVPVIHDSDSPHPATSSSGESVSMTHHPRLVQPQVVQKAEKTDEKVVWKRIEMGTPQQDQITNKEKLVKTQNASINQQAVLIDLLEKIQIQPRVEAPNQNNREIEELLILAKESILAQQEQLELSQAEIKQSKQVATYYSPSLTKPDVY